MAREDLPARIMLVDGTCVFCSRIVRFVLRHDPRGIFHFAQLQSDFGARVLARHGRAGDLDGVYLLVDGGTRTERLLVDGAAGREIWPRLFVLARVLRFVPLPLLNLQYRLLARYRYRLFGKYDGCVVPTGEERARLVE